MAEMGEELEKRLQNFVLSTENGSGAILVDKDGQTISSTGTMSIKEGEPLVSGSLCSIVQDAN